VLEEDGKGQEGLSTLTSLHGLPPPAGSDPRIDLALAQDARGKGFARIASQATERD
jgi:hypothetical protein